MNITSCPQPCQFMRVPLEVRRIIYRELFLPSEPLCLGDEYRKIDPKDGFGKGRPPHLNEQLRKPPPSRHINILRTSRAIYSEAVSLFYAEVGIVILEQDVEDICSAWPVEKKYKIDREVWKHNPLFGMGHPQENGEHIYNTVVLNGLLEPHVFARLQNVRLELSFIHWRFAIPFEIDDHRNVTWDERCMYPLRQHVRSEHFTMLKDLTRLISNLKFVKSLLVCLQVGIEVDGDWSLKKYRHKFPLSPDEANADSKVSELNPHPLVAATIPATEAVLCSGIFDTFKLLCNVQKFDLLVTDFTFEHRGMRVPEGRVEEMTRKVKETVEENFLPCDNIL